MIAKFIKSKRLVALVVFSLACAVLAIVGLTKTDPVSEIEKLGGRIRRVGQNEAIRNVVFWLDKQGWSTVSSLITHRFYPVWYVMLNLEGVSDEDLVHLEGFNKLYVLDLSNTRITDEGLDHLNGLTKIKHLSLRGTRITDAGLTHLKTMSQLIDLNLTNTQVTDEGREELKRAIPGLEIN